MPCRDYFWIGMRSTLANRPESTNLSKADGMQLPVESLALLLCALLLSWSIICTIRFFRTWLRLRDRFPDSQVGTDVISDGSFRLVRMSMRTISISVAVELYPSALWIRPSFPLGAALRGLFIPWTSLQATTGKFLWFDFVGLRIDGSDYRLRIGGKAGRGITQKILDSRINPGE
jgi:hypothetical protein